MKKNVNAFREHLENIVRMKEACLEKQKKEVSERVQYVCKFELASFCEEVCQLYIERGVSNLFLSSLVTTMAKRIQTDRTKILNLINEVLNNDIKFLTKHMSSSQIEMIKIDQ